MATGPAMMRKRSIRLVGGLALVLCLVVVVMFVDFAELAQEAPVPMDEDPKLYKEGGEEGVETVTVVPISLQSSEQDGSAQLPPMQDEQQRQEGQYGREQQVDEVVLETTNMEQAQRQWDLQWRGQLQEGEQAEDIGEAGVAAPEELSQRYQQDLQYQQDQLRQRKQQWQQQQQQQQQRAQQQQQQQQQREEGEGEEGEVPLQGRGHKVLPKEQQQQQQRGTGGRERRPATVGPLKGVGLVPKSPSSATMQFEEKDLPCVEVWDTKLGMNRCLPQAVIAGFPKCGTSQLRIDLGRCHPQILAAKGEPTGLINGSVRGYLEALPVVTREENQLFIEASPSYSKTPFGSLLTRAKTLLPDGKFIFLVRNPVERFYSHFRMHLRNGKLDRWLGANKDQCIEDTSLCLEQLLVFGALRRSSEWLYCVTSNYGRVPQFTQLDTSADMSITQLWMECIEKTPRVQVSWEAGMFGQIMVPSYVDVLQTFSSSFDDVYVVRSEDFFDVRSHSTTVLDLLEFLGVDPIDEVVDCFAEEGNSKAEANREQEEELHIHVTPISPRLYRLLKALHWQDTVDLEAMLGRELHWFDDEPSNFQSRLEAK